MVVDASALLAIFLDEPQSPQIEKQLEQNRPLLLMSIVNLVEVLILIQDKRPGICEKIKPLIFKLGIRFIPPTVSQALVASEARFRYRSHLNLGDCFAYALAKEENCPVITLDGGFKKTDIQVLALD